MASLAAFLCAAIERLALAGIVLLPIGLGALRLRLALAQANPVAQREQVRCKLSDFNMNCAPANPARAANAIEEDPVGGGGETLEAARERERERRMRGHRDNFLELLAEIAGDLARVEEM